MDDISPAPLSSLIRVEHRCDGSVISTTKDEINLLHWNIRDLTNKLHLVELRIATFSGTLHIIVISETWLNSDNISTYQLNGYQAIHNVRQSKGGGISIFIHESLCKQPPITINNLYTSELHHFLVVRIPTISITVAVPYNRPGGSTPAFLVDLERICLNLPNCLLMGDLNLDQLDKVKHAKLTELLETSSFALINAINPVAVTRRASGSILDLVASNMLLFRYKVSIVHHASSDHAMVYASINRNQELPSCSAVRKKFYLNDAIQKVFDLCERNNISCGNGLNIALEQIVHDCTRIVTIKSDHRIKKSHVNRDLILAVRERDLLFSLQRLHPDNSYLVQKYKDMKLHVELMNGRLKSQYNADRIVDAAGDARKTWRLYKEIVFNQYQQKDVHTVTINGTPTNDSVDSCNAINTHFCTAGEHLATTIVSIHGYDADDIDNLYVEHASNDWSFKNVDSKCIYEAIVKLPNKKSTGIDKVPIDLLKATANVISPLIALCLNFMVLSSLFPVELLKGRLKLIHKSGDNDIENFRGLTLLPSVSKVFEYVLSEQLIEYLNSINFFSGHQYGFLKNSSCVGAAHQLVDFIKANFRMKSGRKKKYVACLFVDLKRAFDTVDPKRLERKIRRIGLSSNASKLILSYLQDRRTATVIGEKTSMFRKIMVGVAQGSKIGPLLFIMYINDILQLDFLGNILLYADDTVLYYAADSPAELERTMQSDAKLLHKWLCRNVLTLNVSKTCYMTFGRANQLMDFNIMIENEVIKRVRSYK